MTIRVLVVDDSLAVRQLLKKELSEDPDIEVVGTATDPFMAKELIIKLKPDVITLDIEMPKMDGLTFLKKLMKHHPMPVIIVSSLTAKGSAIAMEAIKSGAVEVMQKPTSIIELEDLGIILRDKVKSAYSARLDVLRRMLEPTKPVNRALRHSVSTDNTVIAVGASTGGTQAIEVLLRAMPRGCPGIVIVQHMPAGFTNKFAERLNSICEIDVKEGKDGDLIVPSQAIIAPGDKHMLVKRSGDGGYYVQIKGGPLVSRHRPSVDVLFRSVAQSVGKNAIGVMLTGMGKDGAKGMLDMKEKGAFNIAQDEETSIVYGMPKCVVENGAADRVASLYEIADIIIEHICK